MTEHIDEPIHVAIAMNFSDEIINSLREISPKLHIERYWPEVPEHVWKDVEVLYTLRHFPLPEQAPKLRWIQLHSAGLDNVINQPIVKAEDVDITSTSGIHAGHMAEYCLMMMLAFEYKLPQMLAFKEKGEWPEKSHRIFSPYGLRDKVVGIVGYGSIGREIARLANAFGMRILASKRDVRQATLDGGYEEPDMGDPDASIPERIYPGSAIKSMASACDFLILTVPLTPDTTHLVNEDVLSAMKETAIIINVARGSVIDEEALISALAAGKIGGAALDVFEEEPLPAGSPLWNLDNVIISPHIAGNHARYHEKAAALFAENLKRYLEKRPLLNLLDRKQGY